MNKRTFPWMAVAVLSPFLLSCGAGEDKAPYGLQCEYLENPVGIDVEHPRLTWKLPDLDAKDAPSLSVYLSADSSCVKGQNPKCLCKELPFGTNLLAVEQDTLQAGATYYWAVAADGKLSAVASFTMAFPLDAPWISDGHDAAYKPSSLFRKSIVVKEGLKRAYWMIASAGLHELHINGAKVGDHYLDPMFTRFDKRILSVTHDVTKLLHAGTNELQVQLGNGWYNHQSKAVWFFDEAVWRNRPSFSARLVLEYSDGKKECVLSDESWETTDSPVVFNSIYTAEHYDARIDVSQAEWGKARLVDCPTRLVKSQLLRPIRNVAKWEAKYVKKLNDSLYVYYFPKNMAGIVRFTAKGERGTVVRLKHGEMLNADSTVSTANIDYHYRPVGDSDPFQTDIVTLSGSEDVFEPKFNYKGFQYVEVSASAPLALDEQSVVALELHSDVPAKGRWHSSSDLLNKLWAATNNSYLSNLFGYPTDCPQREKNGWTGDAFWMAEVGLYNFDVITIYEKWIADFADEQRPNGELPAIVPTAGWGYDWANGVDWTSAVVFIPWMIYQYYGDAQLLENMYGPMKRYMDFVAMKLDGNLTDWGLGDWIPVKTVSELKLMTSTYYYADLCIMSKVASLLGREDESLAYRSQADAVRQSINDAYLDKETGIYANGSQTELAMPLYWGVVPDEYKAKVAAELNARVVANGYHLDVGVHGCRTLLGALSDNGYIDTAYRLAVQDTYPSWGYWIKQGATTLHENWKTDVIIDNSLNHIMFGEIGIWLYKHLAGITVDDSQPGFRLTHLKPYFPSGMDYLDVDYDTPWGRLAVSWKREGGSIRYRVSVPAGMTVDLSLPDGQGHEMLASGTHEFTWKI